MKTDKELEEFTKYILKEVNLETPSVDFVNKVMNTIHLEKKAVANTSFKPLIPTYGWIIFVTIFIVIVSYIFSIDTQIPSIFSSINVSFFNNIPSIDFFNKIHFSNTFTISFVIFSILVIFQLIVIKNYFNKRTII